MIKVLIAEDAKEVREVLTLMLRVRGCDPVEAADGRAAVEMASSAMPDLILMNMPGLDGWEATRLIRACEGTRHIPIVVVSAQCGGEWKERAIEAGAAECVQKPVNSEVIDRVLRRHLPGRS